MSVSIDDFLNMALRLLGKAETEAALYVAENARLSTEIAVLRTRIIELEAASIPSPEIH